MRSGSCHCKKNEGTTHAAAFRGWCLGAAKVNALREFALPALPGTLPKYDNENLECTFDDQIVGFGEGWGGADAVHACPEPFGFAQGKLREGLDKAFKGEL
jgi:hypothetical protein